MSRKKTTRTTSFLDGIQRGVKNPNNEKLERHKYVYENGVKKKILNEELIGRKLKPNTDYDGDWEEQRLNYFSNEETIVHHDHQGIQPRKRLNDENWHEESKFEVDNSRKRKGARELYESDYDEYETEYENDYNNEIDDEYNYEQEELETFEKEYDEYQQERDCTGCKECDKTNRKISNYTKVTFILILIILSAGLGYAISFFDGITY